jgi:hypothetical protein
MTQQYRLFMLACVIMHASLVYPAVTITGDSATGTTSFSFPIDTHSYDKKNQNFFVGAQAGAGGVAQVKDFALSMLPANGGNFIPLAPQTVQLNLGEGLATNPLYDAGISFLGLVYGQTTRDVGHPAVVKAGEPSTLYFYYNLNAKIISLFQYVGVKDAIGLPTSGIVGMSLYSQSYLMLGVKPQATTVFGDPGSGIAVFVLGTVTQGKGLQTQNWREFAQVNVDTGTVVDADGNSTGKSAPFDRGQAVLTIGSPLTSLGQVIDIHYDQFLNRFYIAVQLQAGGDPTDGGKAIVIGTMKNNKLTLSNIAPDSAFDTNQNKIIGTIGANAQVSIQKVRSMRASTNLPYLIVVGGNGDPTTTKRMVYALPLVSGTTDAGVNGTLANKNVAAQLRITGKVPFQVGSRSVRVAATQPGDMTLATDAAALVGGGEIEAGDIVDIWTRTDTIFVAVGNATDVNQLPGIYYSQALFDAGGKIKDWTVWQRVAGTTDQVFGTVLEQTQGNFLYMTGMSNTTINTVKRTQWSTGAAALRAPLVSALASALPADKGGIEKLVDLQQNTPGLNGISLLVATGGDTVVLAQSGAVVNTVLQPTAGALAWPSVQFENGTIDQILPIAMDNPTIVAITGGVLSDVSRLVTATVATNGAAGTQGWLFVGGTHGVAVLSDTAGNGWDTAIGLGPNFVGLQAGMSFKTFGNYSLVRTLVFDGNFLYVLTDTQLDRIDLREGNPGLGLIEPVCVAATQSLLAVRGRLVDCLISGSFALLGTTSGLLRVGNGQNIQTAQTESELQWTYAPPIEGSFAVNQIIPITKTGRAQDATNPLYDGANVYVLNTYRGRDRAQVNRFTIAPVTSSIDDNTLQAIGDMYVRDELSFLINYGSLRTLFMTDGSLFMAGRGRIRSDVPLVTVPLASLEPQSGFEGKSIGIPQSQSALPLDISDFNSITTIIREWASGSWFISGDFGLRINE